MERTFGPTATADAHASRRPIVAVAGMTMPALERRSPGFPSSLTNTRSCSRRIGRPCSSSGGAGVGAGELTERRYPLFASPPAAGRRQAATACHGRRTLNALAVFRPPAVGTAAVPWFGLPWGCPLSWLSKVREEARDRLAAATRGNDADLVARRARRPADDDAAELAERQQPPIVVVEQAEPSVSDDVPRGVRIAAAWAWRFLVLAAAAYVIIRVLGTLRLVVIPIAVSLLLAALLQPWVAWLRERGVPRTLSAVIVLVTGIAAVAGTLTVVIQAFVNGFSDLSTQVTAGIEEIRSWLVNGPFGLSEGQLDEAIDNATDAITENQGRLTAAGLSTATTVGHILTGFFLVLFTTFFFLKDGRAIWNFVVRLFPRAARAAVDQAGQYSWGTLIAYVRATVLVAFVDALGIGLAIYVLRVPLALPLAALVFLGSFIPVIGATLSGAVAVLVALVAKGPVTALLVLAAVIAVQQLEGHVLQPLLLGRAVALHPLGVIMALGAGVVVAGIVGALVAVPLVAVVNTAVRYLVEYNGRRGKRVPPGHPEPPGTEATDDRQAEAEASAEHRTEAAERRSDTGVPPSTDRRAGGAGPA